MVMNRKSGSMGKTGRWMERWKGWKAAGMILLAVLWLYGCQRYSGIDAFQPESSSIYITKDGGIFSGMVESFTSAKQENYQQESLQRFVLEEVALFNESLGASKAAQNEEGKEVLPVSVKSCTLTDNRAAAVYQYKDSGSFLEFGRQYFGISDRLKGFGVYSMEEVKREGWLEGEDLVKPAKGAEVKALEGRELEKLDKGRVIWLETEHPVEIQVEGRIRCMTRGIVLESKSTAQVPAGSGYLIFW